jgi:hypothetical protein
MRSHPTTAPLAPPARALRHSLRMTPKPPRRACQVTDCDEAQHGHGLCHAHLEAWRRRCKMNPETSADDLRPDRAAEVERERWVKAWLMNGKGTPLMPEVCPWPCEYHLRMSIPIIDCFTDPEAIAEDYARHREELLARAEESGREVWAARYFEDASG